MKVKLKGLADTLGTRVRKKSGKMLRFLTSDAERLKLPSAEMGQMADGTGLVGELRSSVLGRLCV